MTHPLVALELTLWRSDTRYNRAQMEATFASDFREFGRSGRRYAREDLLPNGESHEINATLHDMSVTEISADVALVTYISEVRRPSQTDWANRASLWDHASGRWQIRFHQGTPCEALP